MATARLPSGAALMTEVIDLAAFDFSAMDTSPLGADALNLDLDRMAAAVHEASHVVVAKALGVWVLDATVDEEGGGQIRPLALQDSREVALIGLSSFCVGMEASRPEASTGDYRDALAAFGSADAVHVEIAKLAEYMRQDAVQNQILLLGACLYSRGTIERPDLWVTVPPLERWW